MSEHPYLRLTRGASERDLWLPGKPVDERGNGIDLWRFAECTSFEGGELHLPTSHPGARPPLTLGLWDVPIADPGLGEKLASLAGEDLQLLPASADDGDVYIVNILRCVDCIDESRTSGTRWTADDGRPEKTGQYRMIMELSIDATRAEGAHIFRLKGWETPVIVSEELARRLELNELAGLKLRSVT